MGGKFSGKRGTVAERFWRYVQPGPPDACWEWKGSTQEPGYGTLGLGGGSRRGFAHRVSWEIHRGPLKPGEHVLHTCDNPPCVNPDHLFLGDQAANMRDAWAKGRLTDLNKLRQQRQAEGTH